jgi:dihydropteroate synthase
VQNTGFSTNKTLNLGGRLLNLQVPCVMGILNVTPDSFYDGGRYSTEAEILSQVGKMLEEGAQIIDVGGYSTRPGAHEISVGEELERSLAAMRSILKSFPGTIISIDTFRSEVARAAVDHGALMINDVSGGNLDPEMHAVVAKLRAPYILMHMRGNPQTMTSLTKYDNLIKDIIIDLQSRLSSLHTLGIKDVVIDPGFGFSKTREQNFALLNELEKFGILGKPVMVGLSRKSMVWKTLNLAADQALNGTTVLNTIALLKGASLLRVHNVKEAVEAIKLVQEMRK